MRIRDKDLTSICETGLEQLWRGGQIMVTRSLKTVKNQSKLLIILVMKNAYK